MNRRKTAMVAFGILGVLAIGGGAWTLATPSAPVVSPHVVGSAAPGFRAASTRGPIAFSGRGPAVLYFYEADT